MIANLFLQTDLSQPMQEAVPKRCIKAGKPGVRAAKAGQAGGSGDQQG